MSYSNLALLLEHRIVEMSKRIPAYGKLYLYSGFSIWTHGVKNYFNLVRKHPLTKKPSLFLSPHTMVRIVEYDDNVGRELLDFLIEHSIQSKYVYKHIWNNDDIVMWDNRCTMHSVEPFDNNTIKRIMHRVTLVGDQEPMMA